MIKKNDFVQIEYTGKVQGGDIFDTNILEDAKKIGLKIEEKPLIICIGQGMILPSIDDFLTGKEIGEHDLKLEASKAFGHRKREMIKTMPISVFKNSQTPPYPGAVFSFDNMLGKVTSVSAGRVIVDFNNPVAGKDVEYKLIVKKIIENNEEKVKALMTAFWGKDVPFKIEGNKIEIETEKNFAKFFEMFSDKFKQILNLELEIKEKKDSKDIEIKKEEKK